MSEGENDSRFLRKGEQVAQILEDRGVGEVVSLKELQETIYGNTHGSRHERCA